MMGMETVAMPVLEGMRKDRAKVERIGERGKDCGGYAGERVGGVGEDPHIESGDGHEHGDAAGDGDDERDRNEVGAAVQDGVDEFFLLHTGNLADNNCHGEEPDAAFGKVPLTKWQASQKRAPCGAEVIALGADIK